MVIGHCAAVGYLKIFTTLFNFFMPWFYYKSGMFYRSQGNHKCIIGGGRKLLYPYIKFSLLGWTVGCVIKLTNGDNNWVHYILTPFKEILSVGAIQENLVLWFLPTLFATKVIFNYCFNKGINPYIITMTSLFIGLIIYYTGNTVPPYITTTFTGLFFYSVGYLCREKQNIGYVAFISGMILLSFWIFGVSAVNMKDNNLLMGYYPLWFLFSITGCVAVNYLIRKSLYSFPILRWVGVNSLIIYCTHWILLNIERYVIGDGIGYIKADCYTLFCITMVLEVFIVYFVNRINTINVYK